VFYVAQVREVSSEISVDVGIFFAVAIVDSVRSSRSGHSLHEIRLVKSIGIISRTVIGLVVSVVCKVKVKRYGYRPGVAQRVPGS